MTDAIPTLPPIGTIQQGTASEAQTIAQLQRFSQEGAQPRDEWTPLADAGLTIYLFGNDPKPAGLNDLYVNEIQTHIIGSQPDQSPQARLKPVETGEKADVYWAGEQADGIALGLQTFEVSTWLRNSNTGQVTTPDDPDAEEYPSVPIQNRAMAKALLDQVGMGALDDENLVEVNDRTVAETYQSVFDLMWRRSGTDTFLAENMLANDVEGWKFALYQWDDDNQRHVLRNLPNKQVFIDPTVEDINLACYAGFDLPIDKDEAKKLYPHLADEIEAHKETGALQTTDTNTTLGDAFDRDFQRPMVMFRQVFIRNQEMPLSVEAALALGKVEQREVADESQARTEIGDGIDAQHPSIARAGNTGGDDAGLADGQTSKENGEETKESVGDNDGNDAEMVSSDVSDPTRPLAKVDGDEQGPASTRNTAGVSDQENGPDTEKDSGATGEVGSQDASMATAASALGAPATLPTRIAYFLPSTEVEVFPPDSDQAMPEGAPPWPTRLVIRQITQIAGQIVDDRECEFWDIPLIHNVNIPVLGTPFGIGEPVRLMAMQRAESRVLGSIVKHVEFFKAPMVVIPRSVQDALPANQKKGMIDPSARFIPGDDIYQRFNGEVVKVINPPPTPPGLVQVLEIITQKMQEMTSRSDLMRGQPSPDAKSGRAIGFLQQAASSVIDYKHRRSGKMVVRLGRLMLHSLIWRLDCKDIYKIVSRYPYPVLDAICERSRRSDWDVEVEETSGGAHARQMEDGEALAKYQAGVISYQTYCEEVGIDYHQEMRRKRKEMRLAAAMQMQVPAVGGQPAANNQPSQGKEPSGKSVA